MMNTILEVIVSAAITTLSTIILVLLKHGINYLQSKTKSIKVKMALDELDTVLSDGVAYTAPTAQL